MCLLWRPVCAAAGTHPDRVVWSSSCHYTHPSPSVCSATLSTHPSRTPPTQEKEANVSCHEKGMLSSKAVDD